MSHGKVRDDKTCLNCGAPVPGRFCSNCGQENIEPKQTVLHLVNHFFSDVTHFDGKFFVTVKDLFRKPGFLSSEYVKGKRISYLDPIRMYIFTSAVFFLIFFSVVNLQSLEKQRITGSNQNLEKARARSLSFASSHEDSLSINAAFDEAETPADDKTDKSLLGRVGRKMRRKTDSANRASDSLKRIGDRAEQYEDSVEKAQDSIEEASDNRKDSLKATRASKKGLITADEGDGDNPINIELGDGDEKQYKTVESYDSMQAAIPANRRDNWFRRTIKRKIIETNVKWRHDQEGMWREWIATFFHNFPKLLFISLPLFALLLKMLYVRRKQFFYVDHGIFSIHLYIYSFIVLLLMFGLQQLKNLTGFAIFGWIEMIVLFYPFWYYYKAMRNFYQQGRGKTLLKYFSLLFLSLIFQLTLFVLFFLFSIVQT